MGNDARVVRCSSSCLYKDGYKKEGTCLHAALFRGPALEDPGAGDECPAYTKAWEDDKGWEGAEKPMGGDAGAVRCASTRCMYNMGKDGHTCMYRGYGADKGGCSAHVPI